MNNQSKSTQSDAAENALRDFDFLYGHWRVAHRKLGKRLQNCTDWETFESTHECQPLMGGMCNVDEARRTDATPDEGYVGASIRCLNLQTRRWSIFWVGGRDGVLSLPPVVGGFRDCVGTFEADEMFGDRMIRVRFTWSGISPTSAHWEQGFSTDGGATWEINWTMAFTRIAAAEYVALQGRSSTTNRAARVPMTSSN